MIGHTDVDEQQIRIDVVETARLMLKQGFVRGTEGNVSARLGLSDRFVITPSNTPYTELQPGDLALCTLQCEHLDGEMRPSIELPMHAAVYCTRPDARAIIHTHSPSATAVAATGEALVLHSKLARDTVGGDIIPLAMYAPPGSSRLADSVGSALGSRARAVLLANHGMLAVGASLGQTLAICEIVEEVAGRFLRSKPIG